MLRALTLVGSRGFGDIRGIEFLTQVPEPGTLALLITGIVIGVFAVCVEGNRVKS